MTAEEKEICMTLISHAETKEAAISAIEILFKYINKEEIKDIVRSNWNRKIPKGKVSLRHADYKEKMVILTNLLYRRDQHEFSTIQIKLNKCLSKHTPHEFYNALIGSVNINQPGRKHLRGEWVKLIGFNDAMTLIRVQELHDLRRNYWYSIYDINLANYIELS